MEFTQQEKKFNDLVMEWNRKINLVSRKKTDVYDLISDSRLFLDLITTEEPVKIADIGTGAGFPGIVIAIHRPDNMLTLIDSINKKVNAVKDIVKRLGLGNVTVINSRAEELCEDRKFYKTFDVVTARSVAPLARLAAWSRNLLKRNGKLITLKGGDITGELREAERLKFVRDIKLKNVNGGKKFVITELF